MQVEMGILCEAIIAYYGSTTGELRSGFWCLNEIEIRKIELKFLLNF
jgi:hypothetical protein